jgi:hypothetical protein
MNVALSRFFSLMLLRGMVERPEQLGIIDLALASWVAIVPEASTDGPAAQPQRADFAPTTPQLSR